MLEWLRRIFNPADATAAVTASVSHVRVSCDHDQIIVVDGSGRSEILRWAELAVVGLLTSERPGQQLDLAWRIETRDRRRALVIPMDAAGERDFVRAMQVRLHGFDNMAVVEALSAGGSAGFTIWDESWLHKLDDERHDRRH
jgi:hypothetical protein